MAVKPDKSLFWLGRYLSLTIALPSSIFAGYLLGTACDRWWHVPLARVIGVILGMTAGLIKVFEELARDEKRKGAGK